MIGKEMAYRCLPGEAIQLSGGKTTLLSMLTSVGSVVAACSCCILPMALAGIGLSTSLSGVLSPLGPLRWPMAALSVLMVAISWIVVIRQRQQQCSCQPFSLRPWLRTPKIVMLLVASVLTLISLSWGAFEPVVMRLML